MSPHTIIPNWKLKHKLLAATVVLLSGSVLGFPFYTIFAMSPLSITGPTSFYTQVGAAWSHQFTGTGGASGYSYSLTTAPPGATVDGTGLVEFSPGAAGRYDFTIQVTDSALATATHSFVLDVYAVGVCVWTGTTNASWTTASNWTYCGGLAPTSTSDVAIHSQAPTMPILLANATVNSFGLGPGGGTITVNTTITLTITAVTNSIRSSVKFQGGVDNCTICRVVGGGDLYVVNGAVLTLLKGIAFAPGVNSFLYLGNGTTNGTLATGPAGTSAEWPTFGHTAYNKGIVLNGSSGNLSQLQIDGLVIANFYPYVNPSPIYFQDWYGVGQFDNVTMSHGNTGGAASYIKFASCTNATISDTAWSNITFSTAISASAFNIDASGTNCSTLPVVTVSNPSATNGGPAYGSSFENDPNNKISWSNSSSLACTWTGAVDTSWTNTGNWSGCVNSRLNYPDQLDTVLIPVTATQPVVSANLIVGGFGAGTGGGTLTINAGATLTIQKASSSVRSDIQFQGATTTCSTCQVVGAGDLYVTDDSTITLLKGIRFAPGSSKVLYLGDGSTGGSLATGPMGTSAEVPGFTGPGNNAGINLNGASGHLSKLNIDGLNIQRFYPYVFTGEIHLQNWYEIQKFDGVSLSADVAPANGHGVYFANCTNATITDTSWDGIQFLRSYRLGAGYNIRADGTNCSSLPSIALTNAAGTTGGLGYNPDFENDPNAKISWNNLSSSDCVWTGAVNTAWNNSGNWSSCGNGRLGYPDQLDTARVPVTGTQPIVSADAGIGSFKAGAGGGTITINSGITFYMMKATDTVKSDIQFQGATTTCSSCAVVGAGNISVTGNATVTLLKGIKFGPDNQRTLYLGDGATGGVLATGAAGTASEWPVLLNQAHGGIVVNGASGNLSKINFDGIQIRGFYPYVVNAAVYLQDWYEIQKFDNVNFNSSTITAGTSELRFVSCTNATVTDITWTGLTFGDALAAGKYNVNASGTNCSTLPTIGISGASGVGACGAVGAGACTYENDPNSKIDWN